MLVAGVVLLGACTTDDAPAFQDTDSSVPEAGVAPDAIPHDPASDADAQEDTGAPHVSLSTTTIDFGILLCGEAAPPPKVVTITNSGGAPLTWTANVAPATDFSVKGPTAGTIAPGMFEKVAIASTAVPSLSNAGDTSQAVLTITTNDGAMPSVALPVTRTAGGGELTIFPVPVSFGDTQPNVAAAPVPITYKNTGNQVISIGPGNVTPFTGEGFSFFYDGPQIAPVVLQPGASVPGLVGNFKPPLSSSYTARSFVSVVAGSLCGVNPIELGLSGNRTDGSVLVQPGSLDFGPVDCGTAAAGKKLRITNAHAVGGASIHWDAAFAGNANYTLSATSGDVGPSSFVELTVTPSAIPVTSPVTPNLYGDTLTITTDEPGDASHVVDLRMTAHGAILEASTGAIDFGSVPPSSAVTSTFAVWNSGNAPAIVSYTTSSAMMSVWPQGQGIGAGNGFVATARFAPTAAQPYAGTATMAVPAGTVLCAPLKPPINLTGRGALGAALTPSSVEFGLVACGSSGAAKTITLSNKSAASFTWSASLGTGYYTITPVSGTLASGASATITVTPKAIPGVSATTSDLYADAVTIAVPALGASYRSSLHMTAAGAIISLDRTPALDFGGALVGTAKLRTFGVVNEGNVTALVQLTRSGASFAINPDPSIVTVKAASRTVPVNVFFKPSSPGPASGSIELSTMTNLCAPLPASVALSGAGL